MGHIKIEVSRIECIKTGNFFSGDDVYFASTFRCGGPDAPQIQIEKPIPFDLVTKVSQDWRITQGYKGPRWDETDRVAFDGECDDEGFVIGSIYFFDREGNDNERRQLRKLADLHKSLLDTIMLTAGGLFISGGAAIGIGIGLGLGFGLAGVLGGSLIGGAIGLLIVPIIVKILEFRQRGFKAFDLNDDFLGGAAFRIPMKPSGTSTVSFDIKGPTDNLKVTGVGSGNSIEFTGERWQHYKIKLKITRS